jgi:hypothetical protein
MVNYFIVDTNVIISYMGKVNDAIIKFIEDDSNKFFYTETVRTELLTKYTDIPGIFKYILTTLPLTSKECAYDDLVDGFKLNDDQKKKFRNDIFIVFEAGYICYSDQVMPQDVFEEPALLTNNLKLYSKFIAGESNKNKMERTIGLYGFEHLIKVAKMGDVIVNWPK